MGESNPYRRRKVLAAVGAALGSGAIGTVSANHDSERTEARSSAVDRTVETASASDSSTSRSATDVRVPATTSNNGVVVQFRDCSRVRIFGNPFAADLVSMFIGYYDDDGRWWDGVHDAEADLPMTIDVDERYGEHAASRVVIGGVDVYEREEGGPRQLVTAQPPEDWNCFALPEEP